MAVLNLFFRLKSCRLPNTIIKIFFVFRFSDRIFFFTRDDFRGGNRHCSFNRVVLSYHYLLFIIRIIIFMFVKLTVMYNSTKKLKNCKKEGHVPKWGITPTKNSLGKIWTFITSIQGLNLNRPPLYTILNVLIYLAVSPITYMNKDW